MSTATEQNSEFSPEQVQTALFAQLVMQQANLAFLFLGKGPHPETGKPMKDLEGAQMLIDQLEMLETKTKGNLNREEQTLLKQSLMSLRLAFVEAAEAKDEPSSSQPETPAASAPSPSPQPSTAASEAAPAAGTPTSTAAASEEESRKKFSKKY